MRRMTTQIMRIYNAAHNGLELELLSDFYTNTKARKILLWQNCGLVGFKVRSQCDCGWFKAGEQVRVKQKDKS